MWHCWVRQLWGRWGCCCLSKQMMFKYNWPTCFVESYIFEWKTLLAMLLPNYMKLHMVVTRYQDKRLITISSTRTYQFVSGTGGVGRPSFVTMAIYTLSFVELIQSCTIQYQQHQNPCVPSNLTSYLVISTTLALLRY